MSCLLSEAVPSLLPSLLAATEALAARLPPTHPSTAVSGLAPPPCRCPGPGTPADHLPCCLLGRSPLWSTHFACCARLPYACRYWLSVGAQPSDTVARLLGQAGVIPKPPPRLHKGQTKNPDKYKK